VTASPDDALLCAVPACPRAARYVMPLAQLALGLCAAHAANVEGAAALGAPTLQLADGRRLPVARPLPLVLGGPGLVPALQAVLADAARAAAAERQRPARVERARKAAAVLNARRRQAVAAGGAACANHTWHTGAAEPPEAAA
jgi:hypothetical protein